MSKKPNPAKLICMGFAKNRLASSHTRRWRGRSPRAWESARGHAAAVQRRPGRWASSPSGLPYTSRAAYPTPTLHRAPRRPPCTSQPTYPTPRSRGARPAPPSRPTLHLPADLPYTSQPTYPTPTLHRAPKSPAQQLPADLPYTRRRLPDARRRAVGGPRRAKVSWSPDRPTLHRAPATTEAESLVSRPTYPAPRPGREKTTKSRSHNHTPESSL